MEESNESIQEEEISRDQMCIDMLASNNSEEFSPLMAKIAKQQQVVDQSEEKVLDYVSIFYYVIKTIQFNILVGRLERVDGWNVKRNAKAPRRRK